MKTCVCVCVSGEEKKKREREEEEEEEEEERGGERGGGEKGGRGDCKLLDRKQHNISIISVSRICNVPSPCLSLASSSPASPHSPTVSRTPWHLSPPPPFSLPSLFLLLLQFSQILGSKQCEEGVVYEGYLETDRIEWRGSTGYVHACYEK